MAKLKEFVKKNYFLIAVLCVLALGCFLRLYKIADYPIGLNEDEASIGYEAYSIAHYSIDRNGNSLPVHLVAWGSGQNALYAYLILPFTYFIQNDTLAIRLPMALVGCLTLIICAVFIKNFSKNKYGLLALFILAVFPWHIMKSRWGLESNLFPDLVLWGIIAIYYGLQRKKHRYFILSSIIFGLSTYAYGPAYCFVPIILLIIYAFYVFKKKIKLQHAILYFAIAGLVALPMVIFVVINYLGLGTVHLFGITIPRLDYNRFTEIANINSGFIKGVVKNLIASFNLVVFQKDDLILNYLDGFGIYYLFALPLIIYGLIISVKKFKDSPFYQLSLAYLLASIIVCAMVEPNINRINVLWFSLMLFNLIGVTSLVKQKALFYWAIVDIYILSSALFVFKYFTSYQDSIVDQTFDSLTEAIEDVVNTNYDRLYISSRADQPYVYYLLVTKLSPTEYIATRDIPEYNTMFQQVKSIGNIYFAAPEKITPGNAYVLHNAQLPNYTIPAECSVETLRYYSALDCTK